MGCLANRKVNADGKIKSPENLLQGSQGFRSCDPTSVHTLGTCRLFGTLAVLPVASQPVASAFAGGFWATEMTVEHFHIGAAWASLFHEIPSFGQRHSLNNMQVGDGDSRCTVTASVAV